MSAPLTAKVPNEQGRTNSSGVLNRTCQVWIDPCYHIVSKAVRLSIYIVSHQGCQQRKIKCVVEARNLEHSTQTCARCLKFNLDCVFPPPAIRRRRNKNETRIKELERKLQEIQEAISASQADRDDVGLIYSEPSRSDDDISSWHPDFQQQSSSSAYFLQPEASTSIDSLDLASGDPVSSGLVSHKSAHELFSAFRQNLAPIYPLVLLPKEWTWNDTKTKMPALFRAILTASSSNHDPELFKMLFRSTGKHLAEEVVMNGRKSLDLIQSLLVMSTWYCPMEKFQQLKFSQYANMAATLVLDLKSSNDERYRVPSRNECAVLSEQLIETCRTFLACYFLCSSHTSMALSFRRPTVLSHGPWVEDCIRVLESAPTTHLNDRRLVQWTKLQRIAEESISMVGLDSGSSINMSNDGICRVLKCGVDKATRWMQQVPSEILHGILELRHRISWATVTNNNAEPKIIHYHMVLISLHEPAFYDGHDLADFRPPYKLRPLPLIKNPDNDISINIANSLAQCISSAQKVIDMFLGLSTESLRSVPVIIYTRVAYSTIVLIKFDVSARMPQSVAYLLDDHKLNPKVLLFQLLDKLGQAVGSEHFIVPATFRSVLSRVTRWYIDQFESFLLPDQDNIIEPMMHVGLDDTQNGADADVIDSGNIESHASITASIPSVSSFDFIA
ncbi:hypothetical protein TARUN_4341 [Trichoderma arundinaceum]|uniref:Zn(2)-C6 fungal-type domain-containing protein n=1 Tax=Trichoderma arundinaceum TaxID=490622 RepID=A0A395NPN1_TRIAR|nr:hypothetical protein TARUN_4341 [Trichoderma arundinaceum]